MRLLVRLQAWDDADDDEKFEEAPQPRGREKAQRHRGKKPTKAEKAEEPKGKEPKLEDLSTTELAELKRESQECGRLQVIQPAVSLRKPSLPQVSTQKIMW